MGLYLPTIVRSIDSNVQTITSSTWGRRLSQMWYQDVIRRRTMDTGVDYIQFLLEQARIRDKARGGITRSQDMSGVNFSITAQEYGDDLSMTRMEILNASAASQNGVEKNALDRAASFARQMGGGAAYWPQEKAAGILLGGTGAALDTLSATAYDGVSFFSDAHWIDPVRKAQFAPTGWTGGTYANVFYGRPFTGPNYAAISAYIETIPGPDGKPRKIKPYRVAGGPDNRLNMAQVFGAASFTDPLNPNGTASADNMIKSLYSTRPPINDADLACSGGALGVWWIFAELMEDDTLGPIIYDEREPFRMSAYTDFSDNELARRSEYEWKFGGWNQIATGHPFLCFQVWAKVPSGKTAWNAP